MMNEVRIRKPRSKETRAKISLALTGRHPSEETRAKMSRTRMGMKHTKEWNANIGRGNKGKVRTEEIKAQWSKSHTGKVLTEEHKEHMGQSQLARWKSPELRARMSRKHKENWQDPERIEKHRQSLIAMWKKPGHKVKFLKTMEKKWQDPEFRNKQIKEMRLGMDIRPNKPESTILALLEEMYPSEWKYVGDGQLVISGKCPDFANCNGRKDLILLHGIYWHLWKGQKENPSLTKEEVEKRDLVHYKELGYRVLIIWEPELDDIGKVVEKISDFVASSSH